jgi:bifunctional non-homologous end joining protein LigD
MTVDHLELSNVRKVLFPESGIRKGDIVAHYRDLAGTMLPHLRDRPLALQRFPEGIAASGFFQDRVPEHFPDWMRHDPPRRGGQPAQVIADSAVALVYLADQGTIALHAALSRTDRPDHPDRLVFDLDPPDDDFEKVRIAAKWVHSLLEAMAVSSYVQTTGSRGLHVVVPLDRTDDFSVVYRVAGLLVEALAGRHPEELSTAPRALDRGLRVFVDHRRNRPGQTAIAPYSVRALPGAPVATPIDWSEVSRGDLGADRYLVTNIRRRLARKADPWRDMSRNAVRAGSLPDRLGAALERLGR